MPWMEEIRTIFDGLIIFLDEKRLTPGTEARARQVASRVHHHTAERWYDWDLGSIARACESDWVFIVERDEQLSPAWQEGHWRQTLESTDMTHFWVPRRWVVPGGGYITVDPWWPDFQLRFVRNNVPGTVFPARLHDAICVPGAGGCFPNLPIYHHVLSLFSRAEREDRVRYYEQLRPGGGLGHYYLYENYSPPEAPIPAETKLDASETVQSMGRLSKELIARISVRVESVPRAVRVSDFFWLEAKVNNPTEVSLEYFAPHPVGMTYHWMKQATREMVVFEGHRSGLFPGLAPNSAASYPMTVAAPNLAGEYILQTTMVQDGAYWFEDIQPDIVQEFLVSVLPR